MKKFLRGLFWMVLILVVGVVLWPAFFTLPQQPNENRRPPRGASGPGGPPVPVLTAKSRSADVPVYIEGVGTVRALNSVLVRSQVDGALMKLMFQEGQDVKAGDPLAQIDPRLYQAAYDQAVAKKAQDEALLANSKLDLDRYTKLVENNSVTKQQADTQRATVAQNEALVKFDTAAVESARTTLSYTNIISPITGRLGIRNVDVGNLIHANDTTGIVTVSQIQPIAVFFNVPQQQLPRINAAAQSGPDGKKDGALKADAMNDENTKPVDSGTLLVVDNTIDNTTGTVRLKAVFPNDKLQLWPGGFFNVRLLVETLKQAVVIPVAALQHGPKGTFVYVVEGDKVAMRSVTPGQQDDKQAVITAGLKADETVVTTGFSKLTDGSRISAATDEAAPSENEPAALHQGTGLGAPRDDAGGARRERRQRREGGDPSGRAPRGAPLGAPPPPGAANDTGAPGPGANTNTSDAGSSGAKATQ